MHQGNKVNCVLPARELSHEPSDYIHECNIQFFNTTIIKFDSILAENGKMLHIYSLTSLSFPAQRTVCAYVWRCNSGGKK